MVGACQSEGSGAGGRLERSGSRVEQQPGKKSNSALKSPHFSN